MNRNFALIGIAVLLMSGSGAWADVNETTIRLMGAADDELPVAVTNEISLPAALSVNSVAGDKAVAGVKAKDGLETANENRMKRRLETAELARDSAAEMAYGAAESRDNNDRSGGRPDPPEHPGTTPEPPGGA